LSQFFYCVDCAIATEEELTPISSQVFIFEGMSLCLKHFRFRSSSSGLISSSMLDKVDRKREQDLAAYAHWLKRIENEEVNDSPSY
jgi:hypothetical protein